MTKVQDTGAPKGTSAAQLRHDIDELRSELAALRAELAREVRTERLVVVHPDDGRELVATTVLAEAVTLTVQWEPDEAAVMIGSDHESAEGPGAWLIVTSGQNTVADLTAVPVAGGGHYGSMYLEREDAQGLVETGVRLDGRAAAKSVR